jgi:hypothetical protein
MDSKQLYRALCARLQVQPDSHGEAHVACPKCGKEPKRGQVHFSFSERGGFCMVCGQATSLAALARIFAPDQATEYTAHFTPSVARPKAQPTVDFQRLAAQYAGAPGVTARWRAYKPVSEQLVAAYRLGYGAFPQYTSKCQHHRLMVPLIAQGQVVGFRGRSLGCDCGKWLSPAGSRMVLCNGERLTGNEHAGLGYAWGTRRILWRELWVVENPIDAILAEMLWPEVAVVATLGVAMWQEEWTALVAAAGPKIVRILYDNDRPGNGGGAQGRRDWLATHERDIEPGAQRLARRLRVAGLRVRVEQWPEDAPIHADVGDLIVGELRNRSAVTV